MPKNPIGINFPWSGYKMQDQRLFSLYLRVVSIIDHLLTKHSPIVSDCGLLFSPTRVWHVWSSAGIRVNRRDTWLYSKVCLLYSQQAQFAVQQSPLTVQQIPLTQRCQNSVFHICEARLEWLSLGSHLVYTAIRACCIANVQLYSKVSPLSIQ